MWDISVLEIRNKEAIDDVMANAKFVMVNNE